MVMNSRLFKVRLTEHPFILDKASGVKALVGRFDTRKKYRILSVYGTDQFTDFLLADEDGVFHWASSEICRQN